MSPPDRPDSVLLRRSWLGTAPPVPALLAWSKLLSVLAQPRRRYWPGQQGQPSVDLGQPAVERHENVSRNDTTMSVELGA